MRMRGIGVSGRKGDPADPGKPALAAGDMVRAHFVSLCANKPRDTDFSSIT
jgi:hypothetical protein